MIVWEEDAEEEAGAWRGGKGWSRHVDCLEVDFFAIVGGVVRSRLVDETWEVIVIGKTIGNSQE